MFSDSFLAHHEPSSRSHEQRVRPKSPLRNCEDWMQLEGLEQWPCCTTDSDAQGDLEPDGIIGSLGDIREDLRKHSPWGAAFMDGVEKRLQDLEAKLGKLADQFLYGTAAPESVAGGLANIRDMTFLTELRDNELLSAMSLGSRKKLPTDQDGRSLESLVYPGISTGSCTVQFPGTLEPLQLLDLVTKTTPLPSYITNSWRKVFYSDSSCSLLQNTFWYVWLSYFKPKPTQEELSRLFTLISGNFATLFHSSQQKHRDKVFIHLPGCLARAVYSAFCHGFPNSNKTFNSEEFLSYLTNLTSEWITGVMSQPRSWRTWPRHLLDPYHRSETTDSATKTAVATSLSEQDVMRLSIQDKPRAVRLKPHTAKRLRRSHTAQSRTKSTTKNSTGEELEEVGVGEGPTFECVWFGLAARSPLLQNYLLTRGLVEEQEGGVGGVLGPVVGRTQISKLPPPTVSYKEVLKSSKAVTKHNYAMFERELAKCEQEIAAARKKHNALLRASDRRTEKLLQHKYHVAVMAERIMNNIASKSAPIKTTKKQNKTTQQKV